MGVFMVGSIAVIASIVRLYALYVYTTTKDVAYDAIFVCYQVDRSLEGKLTRSQILLLSQIEVNLAIISASAPALRPLFRRSFFGTSYNLSNAYGAGYASHGASGNMYKRSRAKPNGAMELHSLDTKPKHRPGRDMGGSNTSEESILRATGITKTTETMIDIREASQSVQRSS